MALDAGEQGASNPTKQVIDEPPKVQITGQSCPDRGTIGRSSANRDYRMSHTMTSPGTGSLCGAVCQEWGACAARKREKGGGDLN